ncbi:MAG TPA: hypothetical protein ENG66_02000 [Thermococcus sp.]|nr:hypothetical protein [Thermococcus sp.]
MLVRKNKPKKLLSYFVYRICECFVDVVDLVVNLITFGNFGISNPFTLKVIQTYIEEEKPKKETKKCFRNTLQAF